MDDMLPPRPGDVIPVHIGGMNICLTEQEALGVIAQLSSALQTRKAAPKGEVLHNG